VRVYRWDLDKTYLETDFNSVRGLMRSAVEPARRKRSVPGAPELLRELARERPGWRPRVMVLSGSPTQMRAVLESKLRLDGIRFDQFILKDNFANLRRGRLRAVRDQLGYKLPFLLADRIGLAETVRETCFGDDAEADALVYSLYADAIAGRIGPVEVSRVMEAAGAYPSSIVDALSNLKQVTRADAVDHIFIRLDRGEDRRDFAPLGPRVVPVRTWFEAAVVLCGAGEIEGEGLARVYAASRLVEEDARHGLRRMLERGAVDVVRLRRAMAGVEDEALAGVMALAWDGAWPWNPPGPAPVMDYLELVRVFAKRVG
jgi:hypothetical protein